MKKARITYFLLFFLLFVTEICIALFVDDRFVRPYLGDVLVTVLICSFLRIIWPKGIRLLSVYVFLFAAAVEIGQYFDVVSLLGLENIAFLRVLIGRSFSFLDLLCYAVGCALFWLCERAWKSR